MTDRSAPVRYVRKLTKGGTGEPIDLSDSVISLEYEDDESKSDQCTFTVDNFDLSNFESPVWVVGVRLEVRWGYAGDTCPPREVVVQSVKGFQVLTVKALDKGIIANKVTLSRTWEAMTRSQIVRAIAAEEGYSEDRIHVEDTSVVFDHLVQARLTNAQFCKQLATREGFEFFVDFDGWHWHPKRIAAKPIREFVYYTDPSRGEIVSIDDVEVDTTAKPASVTLKGVDAVTKQEFTVTANDQATARDGNSPVIEIIDPRSATTRDSLLEGTGSAITMPTTEPNAAAAKVAADGHYRQSAITNVKLKMTTVGIPSLIAKANIRISGIGSLSGVYYVSSVKSSLGADYRCSVVCKRDGRGTSPAAGGKPKQSGASSVNDQPAPATPPDDLEVINPRNATTTWVDTRGRSSGT